MSATTAKLLSEFEALGVEEKQEFVREMIHYMPPWDSGPLRNEVAAAAGDQLAAMIEEEEFCGLLGKPDRSEKERKT